jgi:hypothetical protein
MSADAEIEIEFFSVSVLRLLLVRKFLPACMHAGDLKEANKQSK